MKLEVIQAYARVYENPIAFSRGQRVQVGERDQDNPEWIWCAATDAREGWVHESFLEIDLDRSSGIGTRDYTALELSVAAGEKLERLERAGGWWFCQNATGETGWVPLENIRTLE